MSAKDFIKVVRIGTLKTWGGRPYSVFCKIEFVGGTLSITGVEGPLPSGNCLGGCGQIDMSLNLDELKPAPKWNLKMLKKFFDVWDKWHLNDMKAGTPKQEAIIKAHDGEYVYSNKLSHYEWACRLLKENSLLYDDGYQYGSAWLKVDVPNDVIKFLKSLPDTDKTPAWV